MSDPSRPSWTHPDRLIAGAVVLVVLGLVELARRVWSLVAGP